MVSEWAVELHSSVDAWFERMVNEEPESADLIEEAIDMLVRMGPALGRPLVDRIHGSKHHNMKELRPASAGRSKIRILFVFDPQKRAILLVAGDKSGNWTRWYEENIPVAEARYAEHLATLGSIETEG